MTVQPDETTELPKGPTLDIPLMQRTVCDSCGHLHRIILVKKCACCGADLERVSAAQQDAEEADATA